MLKAESDFLTWTSFPSSVRLFNDEGKPGTWAFHWLIQDLAVTPGKTLRIEVKAKQQGVASELGAHSDVVADFKDSTGKVIRVLGLGLPCGTFDWGPFTASGVIGAGVPTVRVRVTGGPGYPDKPGITWWDDLKLYQDDVLIYSNDFSKWDPLIGAGVGAGILGIVVPALVRVPEPGVAYEYQKPMLEKDPLLAAGLAGLGILVGGGIGLLTGLGIIPVPQIPSLGAAPEGPGAPARLGKYLITG